MAINKSKMGENRRGSFSFSFPYLPFTAHVDDAVKEEEKEKFNENFMRSIKIDFLGCSSHECANFLPQR